MKIEVGKYYRTRDGRKVHVRGKAYDGDLFGDYIGETHYWNKEGKAVLVNGRRAVDLIAEWTDEPAKDEPASQTLSGETIDQIAIDSLKWHFKDKDMEPLQYEAFRVVLRYYGVTV
jgi:hypothetical protein